MLGEAGRAGIMSELWRQAYNVATNSALEGSDNKAKIVVMPVEPPVLPGIHSGQKQE